MLGLLTAAVLTGCGSGQSMGKAPLYTTVAASGNRGAVRVETVTYTTFDGTRVPALFAIPRAEAPRGCLIWEDGLGSRKESVEALWDGASRLGLAMLTIDLRDNGERATSPLQLPQTVRDPARVKAMVTGTVQDLKRATDFLYSQPICHHNIGYAGLSLGGMIGSVFTAQESRIRAVILMSVPGSWRALVQQTNQILPGITHHPAALRAAMSLLSPLNPDRWVGRITPRPLLLMIGRADPIVSPAAARLTERAAREPKTVVLYRGGHIPLAGTSTSSNAGQIGAFLLKNLIEPTFPGT